MKTEMPIPKRVLMTTDTVGGVWTYAIELARALSDYGIKVALATMGEPLNASQREEAKDVHNMEVYESSYRLEWMKDPWEEVEKAGKWLLDIEDAVRPDVIHLNNYAHGGLPWKAPKLVVGHSCVLSWWASVKGGALPEEWDRYRHEVSNGLWNADLVVAPSNDMLRSLYANYYIKGPCMHVPNGRKQGLFRPGIKEDFIFTAGRLWDEAKNAKTLFEISDDLTWPVFAAGDKEHASGRLESTCSVFMLGKLPEKAMASWLSRASIYAFPALYEPFGLSVLEAALSGCALVLGDIPSLREQWEGAALFVHPKDRDSLRSAINLLIRSPLLRNAMGEQARKKALELTPERMARGYVLAYSGLMKGNVSSGAEREFRCV